MTTVPYAQVCEELDKLRAERDVLLAALRRIASEACDHGPMDFCPRETASAAIRHAERA